MTEFKMTFNGPRLFGELRVVESSHRGLPAWGYSQMAENLYVGKELFKALKNG